MPNFIRNKQDEKRWAKAKKAAAKSKGKSEESFTDKDWALVNHIYQKISKTELFKAIDDYDSPDDYYDYDPESEFEDAGYSIVDPDAQMDDDDADRWLRENDPSIKGKKISVEDESEPEIDEESSTAEERPSHAGQRPRYKQPTPEELNELREYTLPYERRLRGMRSLEATPEKNPELAFHGNIIEAVTNVYGDRDKAYRALTSSKEYREADPITQLEMDDKFHKEWMSKNPDYGVKAISALKQAYDKGQEHSKKYKQAKMSQIRDILSGGGGYNPDVETYSTEAGLQHVGGARDEDEGTVGTIVRDPVSSFAANNPEFIEHMKQKYKLDPSSSSGTQDEYDDYSTPQSRTSSDIKRILGEAPSQNKKFNEFYQSHMPLIESAKKQAMSRLGLKLDPNSVEYDMLNEAGLHGLTQAINDYDHNNPNKASFASHAKNKIVGLMMQTLKSLDKIPKELRDAHREFMASKKPQTQPAAPSQPKTQPQAAVPSQPKPAAPTQGISETAPKSKFSEVISTIKHPEAQAIKQRYDAISSTKTSSRSIPSTQSMPKAQAAPTPPPVAAQQPSTPKVIRRPGGTSGNQ